MNKNPALNAVLAAVYILLIVTLMNTAARTTTDQGILAPLVALSLFTLSAAVMGYLFLGQPVQMYLDGKKKEAVRFFGQTVGVFAILTVLAVIILFSGAFA